MTLSQMWDRLNLPILLFKSGIINPNIDGFLDISSLVVPSLPIIWKLFMVGGMVCLAAMMNG